ncbi:hypothetical protein ACFL6L_00890 [candidate division KSB1 bacterium]
MVKIKQRKLTWNIHSPEYPEKMHRKNFFEKQIKCSYCGTIVKIPAHYSGTKGKCPSCKNKLDIAQAKVIRKPLKEKHISRLKIPHDIHPLIFLIGKNKDKIAQYGKDLQVIYELIRKQFVHREEYEKQKLLLKKEVFLSIISDAVRLPDFTLELHDQIDLWQLVFTLLPYTYPDKDPDFVFYLYQRYDLAALVSMSYILAGFDDPNMKALILRKAIRGERTTPKMKELFQEVITSPYGTEFTRRIRKVIDATREISYQAPEGREREYRQIEEDFNFGISWAGFHLPGSDPVKVKSSQ